MTEKKMDDGRYKENIRVGYDVAIVTKQDQRSGALTYGVVKRLLTKSSFHPHGIKVMLTSNEVGRVKKIVAEDF